MYTYKVELVRVVDGDTVDLRVDLGFRMFTVTRFRLYGIDAPEKDKAARDHLISLLSGELSIISYKDPDSFGRWLCIIFSGGDNVNDLMIKDGFAKKYESALIR